MRPEDKPQANILRRTAFAMPIFCNTSGKYKFGHSILIYVSLVKFNWETLAPERPEQKRIQNYFLWLFASFIQSYKALKRITGQNVIFRKNFDGGR
ncbi:hypothetical protein DO021_09960 [Desulfobacter hydrogenophilus]|uniref:Uncharacterized protein n=1 Tax=Desulfobacter hydrogenophilus TaxID=2291 RepID=A0A328FGD6_9BACT|nr:hypothetical protein DO021_09960 [Desulfobacter hydrogenophilus]